MVPRLFSIARLLTASLAFAGVALSAYAATNVATDPGGGVTTLNSSNVITINSRQVNLVKEARNLVGDILPDSMSLAAGTRFYFVLYLDNTTVGAQKLELVDNGTPLTLHLEVEQFTVFPGWEAREDGLEG